MKKNGKTKWEEEKREHDVELEQLKEEEGESLEQEIKRGKYWVKIGREFGEGMDELRRKAVESEAEMSKIMDEMSEEACRVREELWKKASELQKHQNKERELQNELRVLKEERKRTENETLRNHTVQIEQLEVKARLKNEEQGRVVREQ